MPSFPFPVSYLGYIHFPKVASIHHECPGVQVFFVFPQKCEPFIRHAFFEFSCQVPHSVEVACVAEVFGDGNGVVQVLNGMPPAPWHEHGLSGVLNAFNHKRQFAILVVFGFLHPGPNEIEKLDWVVVFHFHFVFFSEKRFRETLRRRNEKPALMAHQRGVPGRSAQRILVKEAARSLGPNQKPSVWRHPILFDVL